MSWVYNITVRKRFEAIAIFNNMSSSSTLKVTKSQFKTIIKEAVKEAVMGKRLPKVWGNLGQQSGDGTVNQHQDDSDAEKLPSIDQGEVKGLLGDLVALLRTDADPEQVQEGLLQLFDSKLATVEETFKQFQEGKIEEKEAISNLKMILGSSAMFTS